MRKEEIQNQNSSKEIDRIRDFGEVKTRNKEIQGMINLVDHEVKRVDSRFLEPACGDGNFLAKILENKLDNALNKSKKDNIKFEIEAIYALSSMYGIELLEDNIDKTRKRLFEIVSSYITKNFKLDVEESYSKSLKYVLKKNIIHGNALTLKNVKNESDIIFSEWSMVNLTEFKRRDFTFNDLLAYQPFKEENLFSDLGDQAFIPNPVKEFKPVHYLKIYELN